MGFWYEFRNLLQLAIPIAVTSVFTFTFGPVSIAFCGHLGQTELASIGLSNAIYNMAGMYVISGLLTAGDTLFSQTYGSTNKEKISTQGRKTLIILTLCCLPCCAIYICIEPFLLVIGQNPQIAKMTTEFLIRLIPSLLLSAWGQILTRYAQSQNLVYIPLLIVALTNAINALLHYICLYVMNMGLNGSTLAQGLSYLFQFLCFLTYIQFSKHVIPLNAEKSNEYLRNWGEWMRLGIPGLLMHSLEGLLFELGGFVAGSLGERELAVQTILIVVDTISYHLLPFGFGVAAGIRVGQYLGGQITRGPRATLIVALMTLVIISPAIYGLTLALRWQIPKIFSSDPNVINLAASLLPISAIFQMLDCFNGVCSGVIRGAGQQHLGALVNFLTLYLIGAPISACLVYVAGMSVRGIWVGLITGTSIQISLFLILCFRMNWDKQAERALKRLKKQKADMCMPINSTIYGCGNDVTDLNNPVTMFAQPFDEGQHSADNFDNQEAQLKKFVTMRLILNRMIVLLILSTLIVASICFRSFLNLSNYFGPYCIFDNGTFTLHNNMTDLINCTVYFP